MLALVHMGLRVSGLKASEPICHLNSPALGFNPRSAKSNTRRFIDLDTHFCFHFGNGYEEDGKLIIDMASQC